MSTKPTREAFLASVRPEDLEGDLRQVADLCGIETAMRLWGPFAGASVSVPKYGLVRAAKRYIRAHYDGTNVKDLVRATGLTERFVYEAMASAPVKKDQNLLPGCSDLCAAHAQTKP